MPTLNVGLLLYPGCMPAGLFAAADLFRASNLRSGRKPFELQWVGLRRGAVTCAHGMRLNAECDLADSGCDALLVPGFWAESPDEVRAVLAHNRPVIDALRSVGKRVSLWSYCTGVALVAQAGRLKGESATATWWMAPWLDRQHPEVNWQWQHACVTNRRTATASGVHGYLPIACEQIERVVSADAWRDIARLVVLPRPQPAPSVFQSLALINQSDPLLRRLRLTVERWAATDTTLARLAPALATSPRTLARKVKAATGQTVGAHVRLIKLNQAGERLLHTRQSVGQISVALGFADESSFRRMFKQVTGRTPVDYRQAYRE